MLKHKEVWWSSFDISSLVLFPSQTRLLISHWPVFCLSLMSWITELFIVHSGLNPMFLSIYLLRTKPRKDREKEEAEEEDGWGLANKDWFRIAVRVSFIPGPLSHAWSRLSCYLPVLLDARSRMRRFVPALLLETKPLPLAGCTHTHTHTHTHWTELFTSVSSLNFVHFYQLYDLSVWSPRCHTLWTLHLLDLQASVWQ